MRWTSEPHHLPAIQITDKLLWHLQPQAAVYREGRLLSWLHLNLLWPSNPVGRALCEKSDLVVPFRQDRGSMVPVQVLYHLRWISKAHHLPAIQTTDKLLWHLQPQAAVYLEGRLLSWLHLNLLWPRNQVERSLFAKC